jgi:hypothetical protein
LSNVAATETPDERLGNAVASIVEGGEAVGDLISPVGATSGRRAGGEFELSALVGDETGPGEGIVLIIGDEMQCEHGQLAVATMAIGKPRRARIRS